MYLSSFKIEDKETFAFIIILQYKNRYKAFWEIFDI